MRHTGYHVLICSDKLYLYFNCKQHVQTVPLQSDPGLQKRLLSPRRPPRQHPRAPGPATLQTISATSQRLHQVSEQKGVVQLQLQTDWKEEAGSGPELWPVEYPLEESISSQLERIALPNARGKGEDNHCFGEEVVRTDVPRSADPGGNRAGEE